MERLRLEAAEAGALWDDDAKLERNTVKAYPNLHRPMFGPLSARELALTGEHMIQEAILHLLYLRQEGLKVGGIAEILALRHKGNWTVQQSLQRLRARKRVHQPKGPYTEWALTAAERATRDRHRFTTDEGDSN